MQGIGAAEDGLMKRLIATLVFLAWAVPMAHAGEVTVLDVEVRKQAGGTYHFAVTLEHADTGWDHYADRWQVLAPDGTVLGTRVLHHPHVEEQPFTRSLAGVAVPPGVGRVTIRARDNVHGYGPAPVAVDLRR